MNMSNLVHALDQIIALRTFTDKNGVEWKYVGTDSRGRNYWEKTGNKTAMCIATRRTPHVNSRSGTVYYRHDSGQRAISPS